MPITTRRRTVLIVDDHADSRTAARLVGEAAGLQVTRAAANGESAIAEVTATTPDIVLLDVQLPDHDGITVAELLATRPQPPIVVLMSALDGANYGERLERAPVRGFLERQRLTPQALAALLS